MEKVVILIDGQNLYYNLNEMGLKERDIDWDKLFASFIEEGDKLIRAYWFRADKIHDSQFSDEAIKRRIVYKYHRVHFENFKSNPSAIPASVMQDIEEKGNKAIKWLNTQRQRFNDISYAYDQLCLENKNIEIVKSGVIKVDPFKQTYIGEKGVDISLAVKMLSLSVHGKCDKIILVSGDYDYSEAIRFVKDNMTTIHIVKLHKGIPPQSRSMSRDLSVLADQVIDVYEEFLKRDYLLQ